MVKSLPSLSDILIGEIMRFSALAILIACLFVVSCSNTRPKGQTEAEILFKEAKKLVEDNQYLMAIEKLNKIQSEHPYSFYATPSELLRADVYFKQKNFQEAAASYKIFLQLHPGHKETSYVLWQLAESYFNELPPTHDRDLTSAESAIKFYRVLLKNYPNSKHASIAQKRINSCKKMLKEKEKYIADFYFRTEVYISARYRYLDILKRYQETPLRNISMVRVLESSFYLKDYSSCLKYLKVYRGLVSKEYKSKIDSVGKKCRAHSNES